MGLAKPKSLITAEEYLAYERAAEDRHEYWNGEIFEMAGESYNHGVISSNLTIELGIRLKKTPCRVFNKDMKIRSGSDIDLHKSLKGFFSYPDVVIVCGAARMHDKVRDVILNPKVVIEVLSPTTEKFDRGEKFIRYRNNLPTLTDYVLVAQDYPLIDHFRRGAEDNGEWIFAPVSGLEAIWNLKNLEISIPLADVYDGIEFPAEDAESDFDEEIGE
ncbi:MAG TPA: Uma2 family endonuclease [Pyrinomonadaceae bacterium]|jgi:Uma2 family endonuclease